MIRDLSDDEARAALVKWAAVPEGAIPAWVAEMDYALAPPIEQAVQAAVAAGQTAYAVTSATDADGDGSDTAAVAGAYASFAARHWGWTDASAPSTAATTLVGDVTAGLLLAVEHLLPAGPVVLPTPCYPPFRHLLAAARREVVPLTVAPDADVVTIDLDRLDAAFAAGARGLLLCSPHNPLGRVWERAELEAIRDVAARHDARVIADEVHAPLVHSGRRFTPYLEVDPSAVAVVSASKTFNLPGLHCAAILAPDPHDTAVLRALPTALNRGPSRLGVAAAVAGYTHADEWLTALLERLGSQSALFTDLLAAHLPYARARPLEATYLAWLDLRAYGVDDPAAAGREHGVWLAPGQDYEPGLAGHVRLNIATSAERLEAIVERLAGALR